MSSGKAKKLTIRRLSIDNFPNPLTDEFLERWKTASKQERHDFIVAAIKRDQERSAVNWGVGPIPQTKRVKIAPIANGTK